MLLYAANPQQPGASAATGLAVLWAGFNLVTGIGLLGQGLWARSLGTYFSGLQLLAGIVSFFWNFSGSSGLLWSIAIVTAVYAFQFWVLVFGTTYLDYV
jgi:hypothetical protein